MSIPILWDGRSLTRQKAAAVSRAPDGKRYPPCCYPDYFHRVCQKRGICERTITEPAAPAA